VSLTLASACGPADLDPDSGLFIPKDGGSCTPNAATNGLEECNRVDDDCDGIVDEAPSGAPLRQPCMTECGGGTEECVQGQFALCSAPAPELETCNGVDDDCDDAVDEDCDCVHGETRPCGSDEGACRAGIQQCVEGSWNAMCFGEIPPAPMETCNNGVDDDCAGGIDEGCQCMPGETQSCGITMGVCVAGTLSCDSTGHWGTECAGKIEGSTEVCDGLDNDCDGADDWNTATGFGWAPDGHESNDSCIGATGLPNAVDGGAWIQVPVSNPSDITTFPTVYPAGEEDWYGFRAETVSHGACFPGTSQCSFVLVLQLELSSSSDPADYEVCLATTGDCNAITGTNLFCSSGDDWYADVSSYLIAVKWGGTCGSDDSRDVRAVVRNTSGASACEYYQLHARFYFDANEACP
jgi:hypothetical protein